MVLHIFWATKNSLYFSKLFFVYLTLLLYFFLSYMIDSYLLFTLQNYAAKLTEKETSPKCILITNSEEEILDYDGINIEVIPIWKWLLEKDHKNKML